MLSEAHPRIRRFLRFLALPYCYVKTLESADGMRSPIGVVVDLLYIFFRLRAYPDNYGPCRLWEKPRAEWAYYYGSTYNPYPRARLRKLVQEYQRLEVVHDKHVSWRFLEGYGIPMPETHGVISPDDDPVEWIRQLHDDTNGQEWVLKPVRGNAGLGIIHARVLDGHVSFRDTMGKPVRMGGGVRAEYLVQSRVDQHAEVARFHADSLNTVRVVTMLPRNMQPLVVSASMRFGGGGSLVDNWSAGGVAVGVDHARGQLYARGFDKRGRIYLKHPVSGMEFYRFGIPYWDDLVGIALRVQHIFSFYRLLGVDIGLGVDGPLLIETNANPDIVFQEQTAGPLLKNVKVRQAFAEYGLLYNELQRKLLDS